MLLRNRDVDLEYIRRWLGEFDASMESGRFTRVFEEVLAETEK
ncbi:MAG: hypothetical protein RRA32_04545 [bacterium]|nr:hypothetical protein [bacterium]